jgi:3'-5' exonuclease
MKIFIDIETIPGPVRPEPHEVKIDARLKDPEKVKAAQEDGLEDAYRKQALDSMAGRIWCIGVAKEDDDPVCFIGEDERELLERLEAFLRECKPTGRDVEWVGHNAASFDMRWVWRRAVKYDLAYLASLIRPDKYRGNIVDTMLLWACGDTRDYVSLDKLARFLGVGEKTPGMDGSKVYDLWVAGDASACAEYCAADVELTRSVYYRLN